MKRIIVALLLISCTTPVFATETTDFLSKFYSEQENKKVEIISKKEFQDGLYQEIGGTYISEISYGQAKMKAKKERTRKVSYVCIFDNERKPIWGYVIPR